MDFYDSTLAKQYARNKTRIIKEINAIEEAIANAVDNNMFSCDVGDTVMTDTRDVAEPSAYAEAHAVMELNTIKLIGTDSGYDNFIETMDGRFASTPDSEYEMVCDAGEANEEVYPTEPIYNANAGRADGLMHKPDNFRVGETLVIQGHEYDVNPIEFTVKEVNDYGEVIDVDIVSRGEYSDEIFDEVNLVYKDLDSKWLDLNSDFGNISDLKIDRNGSVFVKDYSDLTCDNQFVLNDWFEIGKTYRLGTLPPNYFGTFGDVYIENGSSMFVKTEHGWVERNKVYSSSGFKLPINHGSIGTLYTNVFGKNWVKTACGWELVRNIYDLGDVYRCPNVYDYFEGDVVIFNKVSRDRNFAPKSSERVVLYKDCNHGWLTIENEHDWTTVPSPDFGDLLDLFMYPSNQLIVKVEHNVAGKLCAEWVVVDDAYRFDSMYLDDNFGQIHDVIVYSGEYEPVSTWVKIKDEMKPNKGHWVRVDKVWNMNEYLLGRMPIEAEITWAVKNVILDKRGNGYIYDPIVSFSVGDAKAIARAVGDKVSEIQVTYAGSNYTDIIPDIAIGMNGSTLSSTYYDVWKRRLENSMLQDEMEQVINYFEKSKIYTISRVSNSDGKTFHWHISWN